MEKLTVEEAIENLEEVMQNGLDAIFDAYHRELDAMEEQVQEDELSIEDLRSQCEEKGIKGVKGLEKADLIALLEEEEEEEETNKYKEWTVKELKEECRSRGIKVNKQMKKADLVEALTADDLI